MKYYVIILLVLILSACSQKPDAQTIINNSIAFYGMDKINEKNICFNFREKSFLVHLNGGNFLYESTYSNDSLGQIRDQLSNRGFIREINGLITPQTEKDSLKYAAALNSVVYFALLPLKLNDAATHKRFLKTVQIKNKQYEEIEVSFNKESGGTDHEDVFYFWFDTEDYSMDYFAYSSGGNRFRAVNSIKEVNGLKLQDYVNYKSADGEKSELLNYPKLYEQDRLIKLSEINLENLKVN
jgi:hypothetical protein